MFSLRPYQQASSDRAVSFLQQQKPENGILVLPTGAGKSLVIADIASRLDAPSMVFQPSKEILEQNYGKLVAYGASPSIYSASAGQKRVSQQLTLATIGSVVHHAHKFSHVRYLLIDECHLVGAKNEDSMFMRFLAGMKGVRVLGLTATPYRLSTDGYGGSILKFITRTRPRVFSRVVDVVQCGDLFRDGYLAKLEYKIVKTGFRPDRLRLNSTGADYTDESVRNHFKELNFSDQIVRCVNRLQDLGRAGSLVFTRFVEEAHYVASKIERAFVVSAKTPADEREAIIRDFKRGSIRCVCNVGVLTIGFDYPELANVILARPSMSLALYYQMVGRVVRPHPNKETAFVIDMVGLVEKFGRVEDLVLTCGPRDTWRIESQGRALTNVYFGEPPKQGPWNKK